MYYLPGSTVSFYVLYIYKTYKVYTFNILIKYINLIFMVSSVVDTSIISLLQVRKPRHREFSIDI